MDISYDYLNSQKEMDIYLCNPNEDYMACILATDRVFNACFNDLSTFEMTVHYGEHSETYYDLIETMRLLFVTGIGYFQITSVQESEGEEGKSKRITAESYQTVFKRFGIDIENRVYCLYNVSDPTACLRTNTNDDFIPSIIGELHDQVGVQLNVQLTDITPTEKYDEWTITYVDEALHYSTGGSGTCRTMDENVEYAYDLLMNKVEESFGCIVSFDYMYKTIKFYSIENVASRRNAYLSYDNILKDMEITEDASDIVTVMRCAGDGIDITLVNPTGAGYLTDFSYYMDSVNHRWMSQSLIDRLTNWYADIEGYQPQYVAYVTGYNMAQTRLLQRQTELTNETKILQDLQVARDSYAQAQVSGTATSISGSVIVGENVEVGKKSLSSSSAYYNTAFAADSTVTAYKVRPVWNSTTGTFAFTSTDSYTGTAQAASDAQYKYFMDGDSRSYCELRYKAVVNSGSQTATYPVVSFYRYVAYKYVYAFITLHEKQAAKLKSQVASAQSTADSWLDRLHGVSDILNVQAYFANYPDEYAELKKYWIEGSYEDPSIAVLESTTIPEQIDLANELMEIGSTELSKVAQPRFRLTITAANCFASKELSDIAETLKLGDVLTVEREPGVTYYYPVLLKIVFSFDDPTQLQLELGNSLRLDDWGYTMADLITDASSTARGVSSNWQELMSYVNDRNRIYNLIENPLDAALRAANANMSNQSFAVDTTGILGRVVEGAGDEMTISDEQIRILNNMILFTRDNWETAAAAFGKLEVEDPTNPGSTISAYGLVADALIGKLLMGSRLYISNESNTISLDGSGITIKKNGSNNTVFSASTDGNAYIAGQVQATSGKIGGWTINQTNLAKSGLIPGTTSTYGVTLNAPASENISVDTPAISVAYVGTTKFAVTYGGTLIAEDSDVKGTITARGGKVGGWNIGVPTGDSATGIWKTAGNYTVAMVAGTAAADRAFYVDYKSGNLTQEMFSVNNSGQMVANDAIVKGSIVASDLCVDSTLVTDDGDCYFNGDVTVYGKISTPTVWAYSIHGTGQLLLSGTTGSASIKIIATLGNVGDDGRVTVTFTYSNNSNWAYTTGGTFEFYIISSALNRRFYDDKIVVQVPANSSATTQVQYQFSGIAPMGLSLTRLDDHTTPPAVSTSINKTLTATYYRSDASGGVVSALRVDSGCALVPAMGDVQYLGTDSLRWREVHAMLYSTNSARISKTDIRSFDNRYDVMFDELKPRLFKFKKGDTGRDHFGFVVDEVRDAIDKAGVSTNECAAYMLNDISNPNGDGALRYDEFIALNTWEIQKLKARIKELENKLKEL